MVLTRQVCNKRRQSKTWRIVHEEGREVIQQWRDKRVRLRGARKSYHEMLVYSFSLDTLRSFIQNFNFMVVLQIAMAVLFVYIFQKFDISCNIPTNLLVAPIVFPLAFSINTDFQRREKVLEDLAVFKSSGMIWYFCMREWKDAAELDDEWMTAVHAKLKSLLFHLHEYLLTYKTERRTLILSVMYEDFSDASQLVEEVRKSKLPANPAIVSKAVNLVHTMCSSFERLRVIREYRSPRSIRSFNKVFILFLPIILAPFFVDLGIKSKNTWQPYYIAVVVAFVFSALQGVQDKLDDPFDGMSEDDVNLDNIDEWVYGSLEHTMEREFCVGRRKVAVIAKDDPNIAACHSFSNKTDTCDNIMETNAGTDASVLSNTKDGVITKPEPFVHQILYSVLDKVKGSPRVKKRSLDSQYPGIKRKDTEKKRSMVLVNENVIVAGIERVNYTACSPADDGEEGDSTNITSSEDCKQIPDNLTFTNSIDTHFSRLEDDATEILPVDDLENNNYECWEKMNSGKTPFENLEISRSDVISNVEYDCVIPEEDENGKSDMVSIDINEIGFSVNDLNDDTVSDVIELKNGNHDFRHIFFDDTSVSSRHFVSKTVPNGSAPVTP